VFDLKKPCKDCPFRASNGRRFALNPDRIEEIANATAFQCHKTLDGVPQQCAGVMSVLHKDGKPNAIMQVAERMTDWRAKNLDHSATYASIEEATKDHNYEIS